MSSYNKEKRKIREKIKRKYAIIDKGILNVVNGRIIGDFTSQNGNIVAKPLKKSLDLPKKKKMAIRLNRKQREMIETAELKANSGDVIYIDVEAEGEIYEMAVSARMGFEDGSEIKILIPIEDREAALKLVSNPLPRNFNGDV